MQNGYLFHSAARNTLNFQLDQASRQLTLAETNQLPPLLYLFAVLLHPASQLFALSCPASEVAAELLHQSIILPVFLVEVLVGEGRVLLCGELWQFEGLSAVAEIEDIDEIGELRVVGSVAHYLEGSVLGNKLRFVVIVLECIGLSSLCEQLAASSHIIIGRAKCQDKGGSRGSLNFEEFYDSIFIFVGMYV